MSKLTQINKFKKKKISPPFGFFFKAFCPVSHDSGGGGRTRLPEFKNLLNFP